MDITKEQKTSPDSKSVLFYFILFSIAFLPRLLYLLSIVKNPFFHFPIIDCQAYDDWAQEIAKGHWIGNKVFWQAPLYPYFLGIIYSVLGHDLFLVRFIQILIGSLNCLLLYKISKSAFNPKIALIAFFMAAFYGPFLFFDAELLNPVLIIFLNLSLILVLLSFYRSPGKNKLLGGGIILGLSSITHGLVVIFLPFAVLWIARILIKKKWPTRKIVDYSSRFLIGFLLVVSITAARNLLVGKNLVWISSNSGINFFIGNNPDYDQTTSIRPGIEWEELIQRPMQHGFMKPSERSNYFWRESFSYITGKPFSYMQLLFKKLLLSLDGFEIKRNQDMYLFRSYSFILGLLLWKWVIYFPLGIILPLGLIGMIIYWKDRAKARNREPKPVLILLFILSQTLALLFFFISDRYRIPLVPLLIIFASFALYRFYGMIRSKQSGGYWILILLFLFFLLLANLRRHAPTTEDRAEEHYNLGMVLAKQAKIDPAIKEYKQALSFEPGHLMVHFNLALLYQEENKNKEAENEYGEVIKLFPPGALAYNNLGSIYEKRGDLSKAEELYTQASRRHSLLPDPLCNLGNLYSEEGKYPQAVELFDSCLKVDPTYYKAYNSLGDLYYQKGENDRAIDFFNETLSIRPDYAVAHNNLGTVYIKKGLRQKAFTEFLEAVSINPSYGQARLNLGNYYLETQQTQMAIEQFKRAVVLLPNNPRVHYHLAIAYMTNNQPENAIAELNQALSVDSTFVPAREMLEKIKKK